MCALVAYQHHHDATAIAVRRLRVVPVLDQLEQETAAVLPHGLADHALLTEREVLILPGRQMRPDEALSPVTQQRVSLRTRSRLGTAHLLNLLRWTKADQTYG